MRKFKLTEDQYDSLLLALGYAAGAAMREKERSLAESFLYVANAVNQDNPNWTMYELPEGLTPYEIMLRFVNEGASSGGFLKQREQPARRES